MVAAGNGPSIAKFAEKLKIPLAEKKSRDSHTERLVRFSYRLTQTLSSARWDSTVFFGASTAAPLPCGQVSFPQKTSLTVQMLG